MAEGLIYSAASAVPPSAISPLYSLALRDGAVVARWAHNPKVAGSNPAPATNERQRAGPGGPALCSCSRRPRPYSTTIITTTNSSPPLEFTEIRPVKVPGRCPLRSTVNRTSASPLRPVHGPPQSTCSHGLPFAHAPGQGPPSGCTSRIRNVPVTPPAPKLTSSGCTSSTGSNVNAAVIDAGLSGIVRGPVRHRVARRLAQPAAHGRRGPRPTAEHLAATRHRPSNEHRALLVASGAAPRRAVRLQDHLAYAIHQDVEPSARHLLNKQGPHRGHAARHGIAAAITVGAADLRSRRLPHGENPACRGRAGDRDHGCGPVLSDGAAQRGRRQRRHRPFAAPYLDR